jgi:hypothetical protein
MYDKDGYYVEGDEYDDLDDDYEKESLTEKKRKALAAKPKTKPKKKRSFWGSVFEKDTSAMSKRRKALDDALNY